MIRHNTVVINAQSDDSDNLYSKTLNVLRERKRERKKETDIRHRKLCVCKQDKAFPFIYDLTEKKTSLILFQQKFFANTRDVCLTDNERSCLAGSKFQPRPTAFNLM